MKNYQIAKKDYDEFFDYIDKLYITILKQQYKFDKTEAEIYNEYNQKMDEYRKYLEKRNELLKVKDSIVAKYRKEFVPDYRKENDIEQYDNDMIP